MIPTDEQYDRLVRLCRDDLVMSRLQNTNSLSEALIKYAEYAHGEIIRLQSIAIREAARNPILAISTATKQEPENDTD